MTPLSLKIKPYVLNFIKPFTTSKGSITERKGFLITIANMELKGYGDAAPFEDFGSESYEKAEEVLNSLKLPLKLDLKELVSSLEENLQHLADTPAVRHGVEQALLKLFCKLFKTSLNEVLNVKSKAEINVNGIIGFTDINATAGLTKKLIEEGYTTIKIKAGSENFDDDISRIDVIRSSAGDSVNLRVDINGKWKFKEAVKNLKQLEKYNLEYIEQPVNGLVNFIRLKNETNIKLAPDESARSLEEIIDFVDSGSADYIILKPMMIGGIIPTLHAIDYIKSKGKQAVITTSLESAVGRSMAVFAASTVKSEIAHGLGTGDLFLADIAEDPYKVLKGKIYLK
jgi:o-succinylbenzoate synthase